MKLVDVFYVRAVRRDDPSVKPDMGKAFSREAADAYAKTLDKNLWAVEVLQASEPVEAQHPAHRAMFE